MLRRTLLSSLAGLVPALSLGGKNQGEKVQCWTRDELRDHAGEIKPVAGEKPAYGILFIEINGVKCGIPLCDS